MGAEPAAAFTMTMNRGARENVADKAGSISEAVREEETLRYGASLLAESVVNDPISFRDAARHPASSDAALAAFTQLAAYKLGAERALISLFDGKRQHIIAEATRSTPIESGPDDVDIVDGCLAPTDARAEKDWGLTVAGTAVPRGSSVCEHALDLPEVAQADGRPSLLPLFVVPDLAEDERFAAGPYFGRASPHRFYAAVPLRSSLGIDIGVCCVFDTAPRPVGAGADAAGAGTMDAASQRFLRHMSRLVMAHLQSRVSAESYRRHERMVRGLGSMVEGTGSMYRWRDAPNPESFLTVAGREGALNAEQQRLQGQAETSASASSPLSQRFARTSRPTAAASAAAAAAAAALKKETTDDDGRLERPTLVSPLGDGAETPDAEGDRKKKAAAGGSYASSKAAHEDDVQSAQRSLFSRAANIIRESIEIEGALFLDAQIESYGGLVSPVDGDNRPQSDGSSGDESIMSNDSEHKQEFCRVLGFSTSQSSSINGDEASEEHASVPDTFLERVLRRYPGGQVFNFNEDGSSLWSVSDSEEGEPVSLGRTAPSKGRRAGPIPMNGRPRRGDCEFIKRMFPGARSVALIPLWDSHKARWFAGGFVWTRSAGRTFSVQGELSYLQAFGSATMTEVARIDVLRESKAKEDVLGSLSHEIRSPLHGIIVGVELLHDSALTGFQADILHTVENCGRTLLDVLDHLLDFSKVNHFTRAGKRKVRGMSTSPEGRSSIEAGMMSIFSDLSLDMLMEEVVESVYAGFSFQSSSSRWANRERPDVSYLQQVGTRRRLESVRQMDTGIKSPTPGRTGEGAVEVYLSVDPSVSWAFHAQPGALRRIIMNIFGNALKYTSKGSILVSLTQEPGSIKKNSRRRTIVFTVSDSGRGISSEYLQSRLFTPFAQENQLSSGAGLGLSIVKQIVHGLGGRVGVESRVGHGTTVRVLVPLRMSRLRASPTNSNHNHNLQLQLQQQQALGGEFAQLRRRLEGASVALLGFSDDFGPFKALAAENADARASSPRLFMEALCQRYLGLRVVGKTTEEGVEEEEEGALSASALAAPSLYLCTEGALGLVPPTVAAAEDGQHSPPTPVVVVCDNVLAAHQLATRFLSDPPHVVRESISQPVGPRKLSTVLALALSRWKEARHKSKSTDQATSPTSPVGPPGSSSRPEEDSKTISEALERRPSPDHQDPRPVQQPNGTPVLLPVRNVEDTGRSGVLSTATRDAPASRKSSSQTSISVLDPSDFLLVDDNAINLKILSSYIKKLGRTHDSAMNGLEALEACRARPDPYRCIFMDVSMPVMDGLEATRRIRSYEKQNELQPALIIALTGLASAKTQQEAFASGIDLFLTKPVPLKELGRILEAKSVLT